MSMWGWWLSKKDDTRHKKSTLGSLRGRKAVSAGDEEKALQRKFKGTALFIVDDTKYSLELSSSDSCSVNEGDTFDGNANLVLTCSEEVMGIMVRKEIQPQQGEYIICQVLEKTINK